jgi:hypothetical protein
VNSVMRLEYLLGCLKCNSCHIYLPAYPNMIAVAFALFILQVFFHWQMLIIYFSGRHCDVWDLNKIFKNETERG